MKNSSLFKVIFIFAALLFVTDGCKKDESFAHITAFERDIQSAMNNYRASILKAPFVTQYLLIDNAQIYSAKMANETVPFGIEGVMEDLENQKVLLAADSAAAWVAYCEYEDPDSVMSAVLNNPDSKRKLEGYFNQSAVGTAKDINGNYYITCLMLHFK